MKSTASVLSDAFGTSDKQVNAVTCAFLQGAHPEAEVEAAERAIALLGGQLEAVEPVASVGPDGPRTVVIVRKARPTPAQYPRREGRPAKCPL